MQDPIADLLTRIRNAQLAGHESVVIPHSQLKGEVIRVLTEEGYIESYQVSDDAKPLIEITLKYSKKNVGTKISSFYDFQLHVGFKLAFRDVAS